METKLFTCSDGFALRRKNSSVTSRFIRFTHTGCVFFPIPLVHDFILQLLFKFADCPIRVAKLAQSGFNNSFLLLLFLFFPQLRRFYFLSKRVLTTSFWCKGCCKAKLLILVGVCPFSVNCSVVSPSCLFSS